ncbi:PAS domain S-box protein [Methylotuvimicrobium buryatense]|uniref:cyclic-guanylate-specific phosphodiesterase n=2 Tax=Methylotuvimicrobium buryatense TaxID=95641 RepID=A0A4V1IJL5_METBY|nr:PAS domain S-box protein [Methylotuvimicrobium buryatense]
MPLDFNQTPFGTSLRRWAPQLLTGLMLIIGVGTTAFFWQHAREENSDSLGTAFELSANQITQIIGNRIDIYIVLMKGVKGFFEGSDDVTLEEFRDYVSALQIHKNLPGIQAVGLVIPVAHADKNRHIAEIRQQNIPNYQIKPGGDREQYAPITRLEPSTAENRKALGFDAYTVPAAREALQRSRDTGEVIMTSRVILVQDDDKTDTYAFVMYLPIYKLDSISDRQSAISAWVDVPFRINDLMVGLREELNPTIELEIHDGEPLSNQTRIYHSSDLAADRLSGNRRLETRRQINIAGRQWTLLMRTTPAFEAGIAQHNPALIAKTGIALTLLLGILTWQLAKNHKSTKQRYRQLFDQSSDGLLVMRRADHGFIDANPSALRLLGYRHEELLHLQLQDILTHDELPKSTPCADKIMSDTAHAEEWTCLRKDGSEFTAEVCVHKLDARHCFAILRDLTERKKAEQRIERLTQLYQALSEINQAIVRTGNQVDLFQLACRCAVERGGMALAWVGQLDRMDSRIKSVAAFGEGIEYLKDLTLSSDPSIPEGRGPTGTALRENRAIIVSDYINDPMTQYWQDRAKRFGWASGAAFPIQRNGEAFAILTVYHDQRGAFDDEVVSLLNEIAIDIGFALDNVDRENQRLKLQQELSSYYQHITHIIDVNPAIIYALKAQSLDENDFVIDFISVTARNMTGYPLEEWHAPGFWITHVHPNDRQLALQAQQRLLKQGRINYQYRFLHADGHYCWIHDQSILHRDNTGQPLEIIGTWLDITEQKQAEERAHEQARLLAESQAIAHVGSWVIEIPNNRVIWTEESYRLFGLSSGKDPFTLDYFLHLLNPADIETMQTWIADCLAGKQPEGIEFRTRPIKGRCRWIFGTGELETKENGEPLRIIGTLQDTTERKIAENALRDSEARYRQLFAANPLPMWVYDLDSLAFLAVNDAAVIQYGYSREEFLSMTIADIRPVEDLEELYENIRQTALTMDQYNEASIWRHRKKDGSLIWAEITGHTLTFENRNAEIILAHDVTARINAEQQLRLHAQVFQSSQEGIIITDAENNIISANPTYIELSGYTEEEALGKNPRLISSGLQDKSFYENIWQEIHQRGHWQGEVINRRKNGDLYPQWLSITVIRNPQGRITHHIGIMSDLTEHKAAEERIQFLSHFDILTQLPNRSLLRDRTELAITGAKRANARIALMFIDLDRFKIINDSLGPTIGDRLLVEITARLVDHLHPNDTLCRQGGDEFILLMPNTDTESVAHVAQTILQLIAQPFVIEDHRLTLTASIGIAEFPQDGNNFEQLSQAADAALFRAKGTGRNNFQFFTRQLHEQANRLLQIENELHLALERNELLLYYQPQVDAKTSTIIGCEALVRWQHPEKGMIPPGQFIPIAEESGLILKIDDWVLKTAIRQIVSWQAEGLPVVPVSVNLSGLQFQQASLYETVAQLLQMNRLDPAMLELELTEGIAMDNSERTISLLRRFHQLGISLSIDDFGTGYSSLAYLKRFQIDKLKIDQSFVRELGRDPEDEAIVSAIIGMAKSLGFKTIAEGVETRDQLEFLLHNQCDQIQGYYFSKPLPANEFAERLRSNDLYIGQTR